jgi:predicted enzyme related to lactoylglutathione lyase
MKRLHVHVAVEDLQRAIGFYSTLFGTGPSTIKTDYAKWMLDDPRVNFAISARGRAPGLDHLGIQAETDDELRTLAARLKEAGHSAFAAEAANCCYAQSNKSWINDPSGLRWESFFTFGDATTYGEDAKIPASNSACCTQSTATVEKTSACG